MSGPICFMKMEDIDEFIVPPKSTEEDNFRPYFPQEVEGEGVLNNLGLKKKLVKAGEGWEVPELGDEITVNFTGSLVCGEQFTSSFDRGEPLVVIIGKDHILNVCEDGLITMRKGEICIFTVSPKMTQEVCSRFPRLPVDSYLQFQVELVSWHKVIDVCNDGGIMKKILFKSEELERPQKKDEVTVRYEVKLEDGSLVAKSPIDGVEFFICDGHLCPAIEKSVCTMRKGEQASLHVQPRYAFGALGRSAQNGCSAVPPNAVVKITLTLVTYKLIEYVTDDHLVIKKITSCGEGFEKPNSGTTAQIRYIAKLCDGKIFDKKGHDGEIPFEFKVDEEQVIEGLDLAVATMKRGEVSIININPAYGFGDIETKGKLSLVPSHSVLHYEVEMLGFTKLTEPWDMEPEDKLKSAARRKEEGNTYFKAGKYRRAALRYNMAANYVEFDSTFNYEQKNLGKFFTASCNLNNAACQLKLKEFGEAAKLCSKVLKLEPSNVKALFRRAQAYMEKTNLDLAELDLKRALDIDPNNGELMQLRQRLKNLQVYQDKEVKKQYAKMISKLKI